LAAQSAVALKSNPQTAALIRVAVLITCFNRREVTLRCLDSLFAQSLANCSLQVFVVDDASEDGTLDAIALRFPEARLFSGTGDLFWNHGMHTAFSMALPEDFDYYLWLNDDTVLFDSALHAMLQAAHRMKQDGIEPIIAGNTMNPDTGRHSYGGILRRRFGQRVLHLARFNSDREEPCDTMNGNCTLIPRAVVKKLGNLDKRFHHNFGDLDYGLRAKANGFAIYMAPGFVGACSENTVAGTWRDPDASFQVRWSHILSPKGCPWPEWPLFAKRHLGPLWFVYAVSPYVRVILQSLFNRRLK
jgi:GT2 family glycosyltransferase